jgi:small subunit ribosomal protein S1
MSKSADITGKGAGKGNTESFAELLESSLAGKNSFEGSVTKGLIVAIEKDVAVIDVGLKSEGRIPLREFSTPGRSAEIVGGHRTYGRQKR